MSIASAKSVAKRCIAMGSALLMLAGCGPTEPVTSGTLPMIRQLTETQYRAIIADVFGSDIKIAGSFDPIPRTDGLIAVGAAKATVTASGFERYDKLARQIAAQVVDSNHRAVLIGCTPLAAPDMACIKTFFTKVGRQLYRRPLTATEMQRQSDLVNEATGSAGGIYGGIAAGIAAMLVAPDFLLIGDVTAASAADGATQVLDGFSIASRLSFLLWNAGPDEILLSAAEKGELSTKRGRERQIDRMLKSPRLESGVRALFSDMLGFDGFQTLQKDPIIYPAFGAAAPSDAREQTLRTITAMLVDQDGDYRDLFTTRQTVLTGPLAMLYRVGVERPDTWTPFEFPADSPNVGIQSHISLLALNSHPGRSSATLRGKAVRELLLCQKIPDPPANVDFTLVSDGANPDFKTARARLGAHSNEPSCAGCHKLMDPIGLSLENFDGAGQYRDTENGVAIDTSGDLDGMAFKTPAELGRAIHDNPALQACLVSRVYAYSLGRPPAKTDRAWTEDVEKRFVKSGFRLRELLRVMASSDNFYRISAQEPARAVHAVAPENGS